MYLYLVGMKYISKDILYVILNYICLPCCHLPKTHLDYSPVNSDPHVPINTQIIATVYQKLH